MITFGKNDESIPYQGPPRAGYSFTYIRSLQSYILFGGANNDNQIYIYNTTKRSWSSQQTGGSKKPPSRKYHAAVFIESSSFFLISGGEDDVGRCLQDYFILSIKDWKWRKLIIVKCPQPRERHCMYLKNERELIIFGGISHYNENTNDIWLMKIQNEREGKNQSLNMESYKIDARGKFYPDGRIIAENTFLKGDRLYAGSIKDNTGEFNMFYFDFRNSEWRQLNFQTRCNQAKLFPIIKSQQGQGFILSFSEFQKKKNSPLKFQYYDIPSKSFNKITCESQIIASCDQISGTGGQFQILCVRQGKKMFTINYNLQESKQPQGGIEDYLIAIKHQQILSQQLMRKNELLVQLTSEIHSYIKLLDKQYVKYESDPDVEEERAEHIQDCRKLKNSYEKFDNFLRITTQQIKSLRGQLVAINQDFQRCMETQFDQQAQ